MACTMKRIVSFLILVTSVVMIFLQPVVETPPAPSHPLPVWPVLCYLSVVVLAALLAARQIRGKKAGVKPKHGAIKLPTGSV